MSTELGFWVAIAQIASTLIAATGVIVSLVLSVRALREVHADRILRHIPHLASDEMGWMVHVEFVKTGPAIPGVNPLAVKRYFPRWSNDNEAVRIKEPVSGIQRSVSGAYGYGRIVNLGLGPALSTSVTFVPRRVVIGTEEFRLDESKLQEPKYKRELNTIPLWPSHVLPNGSAKLTRIPTFIVADFDKRVTEVEGVLEIECTDVFGQKHTIQEGFYIATNYTDSPPFITVTFRGAVP